MGVVLGVSPRWCADYPQECADWGGFGGESALGCGVSARMCGLGWFLGVSLRWVAGGRKDVGIGVVLGGESALL